jgi:anti-sigma-K factor RskA
MELSIEQLADLRIAINKSDEKLKALNKEYDEKYPLLEHAIAENIRLIQEVEQQVQIKENLILENETLRKEKEKINGEFDKRNEVNYKRMQEEQAKIDSDK